MTTENKNQALRFHILPPPPEGDIAISSYTTDDNKKAYAARYGESVINWETSGWSWQRSTIDGYDDNGDPLIYCGERSEERDHNAMTDVLTDWIRSTGALRGSYLTVDASGAFGYGCALHFRGENRGRVTVYEVRYKCPTWKDVEKIAALPREARYALPGAPRAPERCSCDFMLDFPYPLAGKESM